MQNRSLERSNCFSAGWTYWPSIASPLSSRWSWGAEYGLRAADATHLATAVNAGADRFITNNRRDLKQDIEEIDVVFPEALSAS